MSRGAHEITELLPGLGFVHVFRGHCRQQEDQCGVSLLDQLDVSIAFGVVGLCS